MSVFVSATSIVSGGALNILKQFIINAKPNVEFIIAINSKVILESKYTEKNNLTFIKVIENGRLDRLKWDVWKARNEIDKQKEKINLVVSLQNTTLNVGDIRQIVYVHQGIFLHETTWSPFKPNERKYAFYKYIYPMFIFGFARKNTQYVVQTEWMRRRMLQKYKISHENVFNIKPDIVPWDDISEPYSYKTGGDCSRILFYPATGEIFKNHLLVLKSIKILHDDFTASNRKLNLKAIFTLDLRTRSNLHISEYLDQNPDIKQYCKFTGPIPYYQVKSLYELCGVVIFPSSIESFGLPLLEASMLGKKIISLDTDFAREVLDGYSGVEFIENDSQKWAQSLSELSESACNHIPRFVPKYKTSWHDFFELI
ncbi:TPA: glycosyltransferase [Vibrio parahaemolyticus]